MKFSVIIPAYNQAGFVGDAIRSVLTQSHPDFEVIAVNDASTDRTVEVLAAFSDPRLRVITHDRNRGLSAARNTGIKAATGAAIALLDADDLFCPGKLAEHAKLLAAHSDIGVSYNARFELNHGSLAVRELSRAPATCELADLVMGFPFAPSDMVVKAECFSKAGLFDERLLHFSEDLEINCRLAMAGCRFMCVDQALNQRRYHTARNLHVAERLQAALDVLDHIFADPRCPASVSITANLARASHYRVWAFYAFAQDETATGQKFLRSAVRLDPSCSREAILRDLLLQCTADANTDHRNELRKIVDQFPADLAHLKDGWRELAAQGYLLRAFTAAMWNRPEEARQHLSHARTAAARPDAWLVGLLTTHLLNHQALLGRDAVQDAIRQVDSAFGPSFRPTLGQVKACYYLNRTLQSYRDANYPEVLAGARNAVLSDFRCLTNRGLVSVSVRSAARMVSHPLRRHALAN